MEPKRAAGRLAASFTVLVWGTTFISTKLLLRAFQPVEILFYRFVLGYLALLIAQPRRLRGVTLGQEAAFAAAGLAGVCLYYLLENVALTYTMASNVGVIISVAPFFTAMLAQIFTKPRPPLQGRFLAGFAVAMAGIALIGFNGSKLALNPLGDVLAAAAALCWAGYSLLARRIASFGHPVVPATRRIFLYGLLFMLPALHFLDFRAEPSRFSNATNLFNILYLGIGASALCFVTWNFAVARLGAVRTSTYIYMVPVITAVASALVLREPITWISAVGTALAIGGLALSAGGGKEVFEDGSGK